MSMPFKPPANAVLLLADGSVFEGYGIGAHGSVGGELCFNTAMTGYQEILTDPSYTGQIVTFTFPHIGNVGANGEDMESGGTVHSVAPSPLRLDARKNDVLTSFFLDQGLGRGASSQSADSPPPSPSPFPQGEGDHEQASASGACGLIIREPITNPSNFRAHAHFNDWLRARGITGISGIDTRALTRHLRHQGAQNCSIVFGIRYSAFSELKQKAEAALEAAPDMNGLELAAHVTTQENYKWDQPRWKLDAGYPEYRIPHTEYSPHVVALDYGVKLNILRSLASAGCRVTVVPATATAEEVLALKPDGVFLSNGPGDPSATGNYAVPVIKKLIASEVPILGICLGHQMLGIALGARTEKMKQGHRGANHPVKDLTTGKVEITSQNHGFCISDQALPAEIEVTHRSLFDGTIQGIRHRSKPIFSVQGHPEASPGPQDSQYLFARFVGMMKEYSGKSVVDRKVVG